MAAHRTALKWQQRVRKEAIPTCPHLFLFLPAALQKGFDVFNALDLMENKTFLEKLKFGIGDGNLQYYLYNWKCPSMGAEKVGTMQPESRLPNPGNQCLQQKPGHGLGRQLQSGSLLPGVEPLKMPSLPSWLTL